MFWFKSCPKCQGDLYRGGDVYGSFIACIQCSHYLTEAEEARLGAVASSQAVPAVAMMPAEKVAA